MNDHYKLRLDAARAARAAHVLAWQQSALTQAAYCAQHGINPTTFSGWRLSSLAKLDAPMLTAVPVNIAPPTLAPALQTPRQATWPQNPIHPDHAQANGLNHRLRGARGWTLELAHDICPRWLAQLLREIEPSPAVAKAQTDAQIRA